MTMTIDGGDDYEDICMMAHLYPRPLKLPVSQSSSATQVQLSRPHLSHHHDHHDPHHHHYDHHHHHHHHLASLTNQKSHDCQLRLCPIHHSHFNHRCNDHYHNKISSKPWSGLRPVHHSGLRSILASSHSLGNFKREDTGDIMIVTALIIVMTVITRAGLLAAYFKMWLHFTTVCFQMLPQILDVSLMKLQCTRLLSACIGQ